MPQCKLSFIHFVFFLVNVCFKILSNICCGLFVQQPTEKNLTNSVMQNLPWMRINADFILWWISFKSDATYWRMYHTAEVFSNKNQCVIAYRLSGNVRSIMHFVEWYNAQKVRSLTELFKCFWMHDSKERINDKIANNILLLDKMRLNLVVLGPLIVC